MAPIRVLLAEDHEMVRKGIRALLELNPEFQIEAEAGDGQLAVELAHQLRPDVVVMDISMPLLNGTEATKAILADNPATKVIALSMHTGTTFVSDMMEAGASGYIIKGSSPKELLDALRTVLDGKVYISPSIQGAGEKGEAAAVLSMTGREREVTQLVAQGLSTKAIARKLHISVRTVDAHRRNIMKKLGVGSVAELTRLAIRHGISPLEM